MKSRLQRQEIGLRSRANTVEACGSFSLLTVQQGADERRCYRPPCWQSPLLADSAARSGPGGGQRQGSRIRSDFTKICQQRTCQSQIFGRGSFLCTCTPSLCLPPPPSPTLDSHLASVVSWASSLLTLLPPSSSPLPLLPHPFYLPTRPIWCLLPDGTRPPYSHPSLPPPIPPLPITLLYLLFFSPKC
jgi:hypothetical protein